MKDEDFTELDSLFAGLEQKNQQAQAEVTRARAEGDAFRKKFIEVREATILPVMAQVGQKWDGAGKVHRLEAFDDKWNRWLTVAHGAGAWLTLYLGRDPQAVTEEDVAVRVGFLANLTTQRVEVWKTVSHPATGSFLCPGAQCDLQALDSSLVAREITEAIKQNLG